MNRYILHFLIVFLILVILLDKCNKTVPTVQHFRDTIYTQISGDTTITKTVIKPTEIIPYVCKSTDTLYIPDTTNPEKFKEQFYALRDSLLATKIYNDTYKIATLGDARVKTTVFNNSITSQRFSYDIKYPTIKDSVVVQAPKKSEFYLGTGILGNENQPVKGVELNLSLKTKSDKIFEIKTQYINKEFVHGVGIKTKL